MINIPAVIHEYNGHQREVSLASYLQLERTIYLSGEIEPVMAGLIIQQLIVLDNTPDNEKDIWLYINSPGGHVVQGEAIIDVMNSMKAKVNTVVVGTAASMGAMILMAGTGTRYAMPSAKVMIHQPLGGFRGQATDIAIQAEQMQKCKARLHKIAAACTGKPLEIVGADMERDFNMTAQEAHEYGIVDEVLVPRNSRF